MPICAETNPDLYSVQDALVRCLLYAPGADGKAAGD
jgi:hypothetical protein